MHGENMKLIDDNSSASDRIICGMFWATIFKTSYSI